MPPDANDRSPNPHRPEPLRTRARCRRPGRLMQNLSSWFVLVCKQHELSRLRRACSVRKRTYAGMGERTRLGSSCDPCRDPGCDRRPGGRRGVRRARRIRCSGSHDSGRLPRKHSATLPGACSVLQRTSAVCGTGHKQPALAYTSGCCSPDWPKPPATPDASPHPQQNQLLSALDTVERGRIYPHLKLVPMPLGMVLYESGDVLRHVYFPTNCIVSLLYVLEDGASAEIAVVGNEGLIGVARPVVCPSQHARCRFRCFGQRPVCQREDGLCAGQTTTRRNGRRARSYGWRDCSGHRGLSRSAGTPVLPGSRQVVLRRSIARPAYGKHGPIALQRGHCSCTDRLGGRRVRGRAQTCRQAGPNCLVMGGIFPLPAIARSLSLEADPRLSKAQVKVLI